MPLVSFHAQFLRIRHQRIEPKCPAPRRPSVVNLGGFPHARRPETPFRQRFKVTGRHSHQGKALFLVHGKKLASRCAGLCRTAVQSQAVLIDLGYTMKSKEWQ